MLPADATPSTTPSTTPAAASAAGPGYRATVAALAVGQVLSWAALYYAFSSFVLPMQAALGWGSATLMGEGAVEGMESAGSIAPNYPGHPSPPRAAPVTAVSRDEVRPGRPTRRRGAQALSQQGQSGCERSC